MFNLYIIYVVLVCIIIVLLIVIGIVSGEKEKQSKLLLKKENEDLKKILYRYKDYEAKGLSSYNMSDEEKLQVIYNELSPTNKRKLVDYAETLHRRENQ